jgi:hypothetical protein
MGVIHDALLGGNLTIANIANSNTQKTPKLIRSDGSLLVCLNDDLRA